MRHREPRQKHGQSLSSLQYIHLVSPEHSTNHSAVNLERSHVTTQLVVLPISISNADLVVAFAVTEDADGTATGAPVIGGTLLVWGFGACLALSAIPLAVLSGEDPCIGHGENGDEGEESAGGDLHFEWYSRELGR